MDVGADGPDGVLVAADDAIGVPAIWGAAILEFGCGLALATAAAAAFAAGAALALAALERKRRRTVSSVATRGHDASGTHDGYVRRGR